MILLTGMCRRLDQPQLVAESKRMPPHDWVNDLDHETRIRTRMTTNDRGEVQKFTVQLEVLVGEEWLPVVRYDNAHGEAHIDYIDPKGVTYDKAWLDLHAPFNVALTLAESELKRTYGQHRARFLEQLKRRSQ